MTQIASLPIAIVIAAMVLVSAICFYGLHRKQRLKIQAKLGPALFSLEADDGKKR